ncbi:DNA damage-binding protein 1 [Tyrophagus putrescentiae]|nr:DNA damage-binding protein 1 [Tyrophagus putrescentiae]
MSFNYIVTAQKPTAVFNCISGNFTGPNDLNLILDKLMRIEVYLVTPEGLRSLKEIPIYGRIQIMKKFRMPNEDRDFLFILTSKHNILILEIKRDTERGDFEVNTLAHGMISERIGHPAENGAICVINPQARLIALRIYDGMFNVIKLDFKSKEIKAYNIRMEETNVINFAFLNGCKAPTLCLIYQEHQSRHLKTYEITDEKEFCRGPWKQENVESESNILIPVDEEYGGVIVIGQESIVYIISQNSYTAIAPPGIKQSSSLTYLDNNYIFVGSRMGDSQLIKLNLEANDSGNYIEIIDSFVNLAPIVDMIVVDLDKQGQDQLVTCSGYFKDGSIRIIRNGIGINENATIDLAGIKGVWQLKTNSDVYDNMIAISFVGQTKLLRLIGEDVEETHLEGFKCHEQTLFCGNIAQNSKQLILQATSGSIQLLCPKENCVIDEWKKAQSISLISTNEGQIICSSRSNLYYLEVIDGKIKLINECEMEYEASCVDISPLVQKKSTLCAVGLWKDISVRILSLPDLKLVHNEKLGGEIIPRSILMAHFDLTSYLFTAIGDGSLFYYILDNETGTLSEKKKVILGTQPTQLKIFKTNSSANIFACSDRPTVIYSSNNKLVFSNVNLKEVNHMCTLNSSEYPESLILTNDSQLLIGQIDQIQKLHIRSIPLGETPRRIAYQESTQTFGVLTMRHDIQGEDGQVIPSRNSASCLAQNITYSSSIPSIVKPSSLNPIADPYDLEVFHLLIIDQTTFEVIHAHQFMVNEVALSITSAKLGDDPNIYYIVGTSFINPEELEPKQGRIIVFHLVDGKLQQVAEKEIKGAPYVLQEFNGKLLAAINSTIRLFEWTPMHDLHNECTYFNSVVSLFIKTKGDFVIVGDVLRSITLLIYKPLGGNFDRIATDLDTAWLSSIDMIDDDTFIGSDNNFNLFTVQKDTSAVTDSERQRLLSVGYFHLGDFVNVMKHGSLVMNHPSEMTCPILGKPILFGTYSGSIGLIATIPESFYKFLLQLQENLINVIKSVGNIDYQSWRSFTNERKTEAAANFIDGDIIESFLDLNRAKMGECIQKLTIDDNGTQRPATVDDIIKTVEELSRIH